MRLPGHTMARAKRGEPKRPLPILLVQRLISSARQKENGEVFADFAEFSFGSELPN